MWEPRALKTRLPFTRHCHWSLLPALALGISRESPCLRARVSCCILHLSAPCPVVTSLSTSSGSHIHISEVIVLTGLEVWEGEHTLWGERVWAFNGNVFSYFDVVLMPMTFVVKEHVSADQHAFLSVHFNSSFMNSRSLPPIRPGFFWTFMLLFWSTFKTRDRLDAGERLMRKGKNMITECGSQIVYSAQ